MGELSCLYHVPSGHLVVTSSSFWHGWDEHRFPVHFDRAFGGVPTHCPTENWVVWLPLDTRPVRLATRDCMCGRYPLPVGRSTYYSYGCLVFTRLQPIVQTSYTYTCQWDGSVMLWIWFLLYNCIFYAILLCTLFTCCSTKNVCSSTFLTIIWANMNVKILSFILSKIFNCRYLVMMIVVA